MATYKPKKKIDKNGTLEEVKIPIESVDGLGDILDTIPIGVDKIAEIGIDDTSFGNVSVDSSNVAYDTYHIITDDSGNTIGGFTMKNNSPFRAGDGIKFENNNAYGIGISTDLPTVKAKLTPASEVGGGSGLDSLGNIDTWWGSPYDIEVLGEYGVAWNEAYVFQDKDDNVIANGNMAHRIPLQAGEGIEFIPDTENNVVKINATNSGYVNIDVELNDLNASYPISMFGVSGFMCECYLGFSGEWELDGHWFGSGGYKFTKFDGMLEVRSLSVTDDSFSMQYSSNSTITLPDDVITVTGVSHVIRQ